MIQFFHNISFGMTIMMMMTTMMTSTTNNIIIPILWHKQWRCLYLIFPFPKTFFFPTLFSMIYCTKCWAVSWPNWYSKTFWWMDTGIYQYIVSALAYTGTSAGHVICFGCPTRAQVSDISAIAPALTTNSASQKMFLAIHLTVSTILSGEGSSLGS